MAAISPLQRLFGRESEIGALRDALDRVVAGRSSIVLISGEAGIGKTRLLDGVLDDARRRGIRVAAGRAEDLDRSRPFGLAADLLGCTRSAVDPRRVGVAAMLAGSRDGDGAPITVTSDTGLQFRVIDAMVDLVEELAVAEPLVLGADDLQWADPSSLLTIGALARRIDHLPVVLLGCLRPTPRVQELDRLIDLLRALGAGTITLDPLGVEAVRELLADRLGAEPGPGMMTQVAGAAGNPLFITELLGALAQSGTLNTTDGRAEVASVALPPTLRLTILHRLSFLPHETLIALRAASILGSAFSLTDLAVLTARSALDLSTALDEAFDAGVVGTEAGRLRFRHDLIRDSIYQDIPEDVRRGLHREAGQRLAAAGAPARQVAEHLARAATRGDSETLSWLVKAARGAASTSPEVAAGLLDRAVGLMDRADPSRDRVATELATSMMWAGRFADAASTCRAVLTGAHDPAAAADAWVCLALGLLTTGRPRDALEELTQAARAVDAGSRAHARALALAAMCRAWLVDLPDAVTGAVQARAAAAACHDGLAASLALSAQALAAELRGQMQDAADLFDHAASQADRSADRAGHRQPVQVTRAFLLVELDRLTEARAAIDAGSRISEELGLRWHACSYQIVSAMERFVAGEWDDAIAELEAGIELADETSQRYSLVLGSSVLAMIRLHRGQLDLAKVAADTAVGEITAAGPRYRAYWARRAQALVLDAQGRTRDAFTVVSACWQECAEHGLAQAYRTIGRDAVRLALACGDLDWAGQATARVVDLARSNDTPGFLGAALHCRGLVADDPDLLGAAVGAYATSPRPLELALAREDTGASLARAGRGSEARGLLEEAAGTYERLNATWDLARAESLLRGLGVRRGRRGQRGRPQIGWDSLTPTERAIADLVAQGLTNPKIGSQLFISGRTVQTHLAHVFAKLDITSRAQLAAEVTQRRRS